MYARHDNPPKYLLPLLGIGALTGTIAYLAVRKGKKSAEGSAPSTAPVPAPAPSAPTGSSGGTSSKYEDAEKILDVLGYSGPDRVLQFQKDWNHVYENTKALSSFIAVFAASAGVDPVSIMGEKLVEDGILGPKTDAMLKHAFDIVDFIYRFSTSGEQGTINSHEQAWKMILDIGKGS